MLNRTNKKINRPTNVLCDHPNIDDHEKRERGGGMGVGGEGVDYIQQQQQRDTCLPEVLIEELQDAVYEVTKPVQSQTDSLRDAAVEQDHTVRR